MAIVFIGTSFESKMQIGLLVILTLSIIDYFIGTFVPVSENQLYRGITGYSCKFHRFVTLFKWQQLVQYVFTMHKNMCIIVITY